MAYVFPLCSYVGVKPGFEHVWWNDYKAGYWKEYFGLKGGKQKRLVNISYDKSDNISMGLSLQALLIMYDFVYHGATAQVFQSLLIIKDLWSHSDTPHSVGLLWTSDQPDAETSNWQNTTIITDRLPCPRRDSNPQSQQASCRKPIASDRAVTGIGHVWLGWLNKEWLGHGT